MKLVVCGLLYKEVLCEFIISEGIEIRLCFTCVLNESNVFEFERSFTADLQQLLSFESMITPETISLSSSIDSLGQQLVNPALSVFSILQSTYEAAKLKLDNTSKSDKTEMKYFLSFTFTIQNYNICIHKTMIY